MEIRREHLKKLSDTKFMIPIGTIPGMRVPGIIYINEKLLPKVLSDRSPLQVANVATLPGIVKASLAMPDIHWGYGFPIGGVAAFRVEDGIISPGGVGYDINCGVRLLRTDFKMDDVEKKLDTLLSVLFNNIPSGVGSSGKLRLRPDDLNPVLKDGVKWAIRKGYGREEDLETIEEHGSMPGADPNMVSRRAKERGASQLGTLGAGNHFLEIQIIEEIYREDIAKVLGLFKGQITVLIHTGSRGLGHQVASDYIEVMNNAARKYRIRLPDPQLACAPFNSPEAKRYFAAMVSAANFAWTNRQLITHWTRESFRQVFGISDREIGLEIVYDVAHNIAKVETHNIDGKQIKLVVHRKGATRAFAPGRPEVPEKYKSIGQPVLVPGDMGRYSFVLVGTDKAMKETFGSSCHGAGRMMSRHEALRRQSAGKVLGNMRNKGILVKAKSNKTLVEEAPEAYKDVSNVVDVLHKEGISIKIAKMKPIAVMKG
ncbi:MAG: RNA-splicing ligase RtcB [Caldiserica bacterium]|nr:MAG: RNA-splicing ligase RtcB [Caldisericota bacterium]